MGAPPRVEISRVRPVVLDDQHHAFTDLCRFGGDLYLTFRSCPDGHGIHRSSRIQVLRGDGERWTRVVEFSVPDRDTRDPHFLVFGGRLFVYTGTWLCPEGWTAHDINDHLGYAVWTEDGTTWHGPVPLEGTYGHYIWRAAAFGDTAYLCGRRKYGYVHGPRSEGGEITQAVMLASDDGLIWRYHNLFTESWGDETAFVFSDTGAVTALARQLQNHHALICRSQPPYDDWTRVALDRYVGGPMIVDWNGWQLIGGRKMNDCPPVTTLYWLVDDQLQEIAELPSGGDTSYTGFVQLDDRHALLSYYSSHETGGTSARAAIYLADLALR